MNLTFSDNWKSRSLVTRRINSQENPVNGILKINSV